MTYLEIQKMTAGRFSTVAMTENSIIVGTLGDLDSENTTYEAIVYIAKFYNIDTAPGKFHHHKITADGARKRGCKLPTSNYNEFIEFFK